MRAKFLGAFMLIAATSAVGAQGRTPPYERPTEYLRVAMIEDPSGVKIELTRRTPK